MLDKVMKIEKVTSLKIQNSKFKIQNKSQIQNPKLFRLFGFGILDLF